MDWYQLDRETLEQQLQVDFTRGLTDEQVAVRQKKYGLNEIVVSEKKSALIIFVSQFKDFMVFILLVATLIAGLLGEYIDAIAIMLIVLLNGVIGFFQEIKAEQSLEKLKSLAAPTIRVLRNGEWITTNANEAVIGDVIKVAAGDRVPADIRLLEVNRLTTDESTLTGESLPIEKSSLPLIADDVTFQNQKNMIFKGTLVTSGYGTGIVVRTGMQTMIGNIASLMDKTERVPTPLELKLTELGKTLIVFVILLTALTVVIGIYHGNPLYEMFLAGISLAVAAIPEGLPAIVTVVLSLGVQRMIKRKAIVRKLNSVETLGSTSVICTDKTGTITENKMTVKEIFIDEYTLTVTGEGYKPTGAILFQQKPLGNDFPAVKQLLTYGLLCNQATLEQKDGNYYIVGDPTDGALVVVANKLGIDRQSLNRYKKLAEIPFDSTRKRMSVIVEDEVGKAYLIVKGAPEVIIPRCTSSLTRNGEQKPLSKDTLDRVSNQMAEKALRLIALAILPLEKYKVQTDEANIEYLERELIFVGFFGMKDPPRKEVKPAIQECKQAGIKTVMITGDHKQTAMAIAQEVGLMEEGQLVLEGHEIDALTVEQLKEIIEDVAVFSRVSPEHKLKIVQAYQQRGHVVAMTGDGVNDAPAIKASDIGISMGISGTDVTKEASALILQDDNFATIKEAIREGRNIYENIRKFIRYLLASNVGEIFVMLVAILLGYPLPLVPVQILWINLITDGLPAMALGVDPPESNVMKKKPRDRQEGIFARGLGYKILTRGILIGFVSLLAFIVIYKQYPEQLDYARTMAFATLVLAQLIHVFDCRAENGIFSRNPLNNIYLLAAVLSSFLLLLVVIYVPSLQIIFYTATLSVKDWLLIIVLSALPTVLFGYQKPRNE